MEIRPGSLIHITGIALFLFIPLVLFLFLRFPFGILPSFAVAIVLMFSHRFVAIPFMDRHRSQRCFWCGRTSRARQAIHVRAGTQMVFECCTEGCLSNTRRFLDFCARYKWLFRIGIFLPLLWYIVTMLLNGLGVITFPIAWDRFLFQILIACTVVSISLLYKLGREAEELSFPFPIHNLFLLGIRNTLLVFRLVGIWWIAASLYFLYRTFTA